MKPDTRGRTMTEAQLIARGAELMQQLDGEGISNADQVPICGGAMTAALMMLPPAERAAAVQAHLSTLGNLLDR